MLGCCCVRAWSCKRVLVLGFCCLSVFVIGSCIVRVLLFKGFVVSRFSCVRVLLC